ncbi:uncharacterized protein ARMOST_16592 [Armillaria ostoyae]|uniref:Uncharacterized protein n=1 Tax=Armillaria ostoyae TaxID=47428 RepID=A0A284RWN1_ARMOS|nr:uncharacterized protein ARMOST_16592 [Armillaria ostoyae]
MIIPPMQQQFSVGARAPLPRPDSEARPSSGYRQVVIDHASCSKRRQHRVKVDTHRRILATMNRCEFCIASYTPSIFSSRFPQGEEPNYPGPPHSSCHSLLCVGRLIKITETSAHDEFETRDQPATYERPGKSPSQSDSSVNQDQHPAWRRMTRRNGSQLDGEAIIKGKVSADPEIDEAKPLGHSSDMYYYYLEQCVYSLKKCVNDFWYSQW